MPRSQGALSFDCLFYWDYFKEYTVFCIVGNISSVPFPVMTGKVSSGSFHKRSIGLIAIGINALRKTLLIKGQTMDLLNWKTSILKKKKSEWSLSSTCLIWYLWKDQTEWKHTHEVKWLASLRGSFDKMKERKSDLEQKLKPSLMWIPLLLLFMFPFILNFLSMTLQKIFWVSGHLI